jgi:hypothetical protein
MATTTNYGWTTPDDTALVKDGAAAIRTLGSSVDTTTKNLNPETTLGDIAYRSSTANVKTRLGLGTALQLLQVNSGATAPEWATINTGGMTLLSTTNLSGASTSITSISGIYTNLFIIINDWYANAASYFIPQIQFNADTGANYDHGGFRYRGGSAINDVTGYSDSRFAIMAVSNTAANNLTFITIPNYSSTDTNKQYITSGSYKTNTGDLGIDSIVGRWKNDAAITSIQIKTDDGTWQAGTIKIYGVK